MKLQAGDKAPDFAAKDQDGKTISLKKFLGKQVALFFYPQDDTPTCTKQACNLRDNFSLLKKNKITVIGVSVDNVKSHKKFETKFTLPFPLVADENHAIVEAYSVWGEKQLYGRKYMGTHRTTFLIGKDGTIEHIIDKVKSADHAQQILDMWG
jgi:peroxiredoxin Q/BCP